MLPNKSASPPRYYQACVTPHILDLIDTITERLAIELEEPTVPQAITKLHQLLDTTVLQLVLQDCPDEETRHSFIQEYPERFQDPQLLVTFAISNTTIDMITEQLERTLAALL